MNEPPFPQKHALNLAQEKFQQLYLSATLQEVISKYAISRKVYVYDVFVIKDFQTMYFIIK